MEEVDLLAALRWCTTTLPSIEDAANYFDLHRMFIVMTVGSTIS